LGWRFTELVCRGSKSYGAGRERCGDLEEIEDSIFHSELNVLTTIRKGTEERGADLNFLFESLKFSHVANELLIDLWHLGHQILET
jgi:hypothetical protein